jgi:hypothetical protein
MLFRLLVLGGTVKELEQGKAGLGGVLKIRRNPGRDASVGDRGGPDLTLNSLPKVRKE